MFDVFVTDLKIARNMDFRFYIKMYVFVNYCIMMN